MAAYVVATRNPYVAVTAADGTASFTDVPAGARTVLLWHPQRGRVIKAVTIEAGKVATLTIDQTALQ